MVLSAMLVLAAALPSNYVMKQEMELVKDLLQYLENAHAEGIFIVQCPNYSKLWLKSVWNSVCMHGPLY